ncbi:MAG: putative glycoside hydrolase [Ruminococcus sp.]|nr:putative glycoside hydrolase [Ruminococcus sp.]
MLKILLGVLILAVLVFVGYSVAGPFFNYLGNLRQPAETSPWTPPETVPMTSVTKIDGDSSETGGTVLEPNKTSERMTAVTLPPEALLSKTALTDNLNSAMTAGFTAVVVPLKTEGGALLYKSTAEMAVSAGIVTAPMTATDISSAIKEMGMTPVCSINLLEDNTSFTDYRGVYKFASDESRWLDNRLENGGKPWISPFDADATEYLRYISDEVTKGGFEKVIFTGLVFPPFRNSDLNYIGDIVKSENRSDSLIKLFETVAKAAESNGAAVSLEVSAAGVALGTKEAFIPARLGGASVVLRYSEADLPKTIIENGREIVLTDMTPEARVTVIMTMCRDKADGTALIPYLSGLDPNTEGYAGALSVILQMGFESYIV